MAWQHEVHHGNMKCMPIWSVNSIQHEVHEWQHNNQLIQNKWTKYYIAAAPIRYPQSRKRYNIDNRWLFTAPHRFSIYLHAWVDFFFYLIPKPLFWVWAPKTDFQRDLNRCLVCGRALWPAGFLKNNCFNWSRRKPRTNSLKYKSCFFIDLLLDANSSWET